MGVVSSRLEDGPALYLKDQNRFSISSLSITSSRRRGPLNISPAAYPASRLVARREGGDDRPVEFIQDPDALPTSAPSFLLKIANEDDLTFNFTITVRQTQAFSDVGLTPSDTSIAGLTFIFAGSSRELDTLVTREFHADPNLHKNSNVELVGSEFSTSGVPLITIDWSWKWRPPKLAEDRGGGWRNICTFVEYDQRAHRLNTLATFSFWVQKEYRPLTSPSSQLPSPQLEMLVPPRLRLPSSQSLQSVLSDTEGPQSELEVPSPVAEFELNLPFSQSMPKEAAVFDVSCQRPSEDMSAQDDGPLFRATMKSLEQKTGRMKMRMKKVLKKAEAAQVLQAQCNEAVAQFMTALREASASNANAVQPALEHYFEKIAREILNYETQNTVNLQKLIIDPLSRIYNIEIKQAENKKKDFEDESKDYYAYVSKYLGQRQDSLKEKKKAESDTKYQNKRRTFELKRFDYSSFMQDLNGGRKDQEVLSHLTKYADTQAKGYLATAKRIEEMIPQLDALIKEVNEANKEYQFQKTEREEKRRMLEKSSKPYIAPDSSLSQPPGTSSGLTNDPPTEIDSNKRLSMNRGSLHHSSSSSSVHGPTSNNLAPSASIRSTSATLGGSPGQDRFKGIRDLEERSQNTANGTLNSTGQQRKEGLVWAMSKPGSHIDPRGLNKQAWHKYWIVLDQGKLSEYSNWKEKLDLNMDPIDLRLASVREARSADRRFCFEVITPSYTRVYQATSEDDLNNWINSINNALQSAYEGRSATHPVTPAPAESSFARDIGSVLTGKLSHHASHHHSPSAISIAKSPNNGMHRSTTVGSRPERSPSGAYDENPTRLLQEIRDRDNGNNWCADCGSNVKTDWVSINLGIVLCIECSGIHRSLGTHVSKIRSLTLDTVSLTPDVVEIIMLLGNRISNQVWEAQLDPAHKPLPQATRDQRLRFITTKYVDRLWVQPLSPATSAHATADDLLLASIKKNDIQQVLYALALRANLNATDRLRATPAIFLALAAADPAGAASTLAVPSGGARRSMDRQQQQQMLAEEKKAAFPVAEMLVQNGAEIPGTMPAFPLSPAAVQFVAARGQKTAGADMLTALPSIKGPVQSAERERERLQKRTSAGARFGGRIGGATFS